MPRSVFTNRMVAHVWAQRSQNYGRNSTGSIYFDGDTIYSYGSHFPMARFIQNDHGELAVVQTTRSYSVTTTGHQSLVRSAIPGSVQIFNVENVSPQYPGREEDWHERNRADYQRRRQEALLGAARARLDWSRGWKLEEARKTTGEANRYAAFFGLSWRFEDPETDETALEAFRERDRERIKAHRAERMERVARWRQGEAVNVDDARPVMLRLRGSRIETSLGAVVPVSEATALWPLILRAIGKGASYSLRGLSPRIGDFAVDAIDTDGTLHVGCHVIPWPELASMAARLGLAKPESLQ